MSNNDYMLHIISNETKNSIETLSVVTPTVYASIFSKYASQHDNNVDNEDLIAKNSLLKETNLLTQLQITTSKNALKLSHNTSRAINAIQDKDEEMLNEVLKETQELRKEIEKLKESVYKDELTHVYNRKWLHDNFLLDNSQEFNTSGVLVMIDLNYFKLVNDTHGHIIGDKVLIFIANELKKLNKQTVRYGGDEFLLLFPMEQSKEKVKKLLIEIRENVISKKLKAHDSLFRTSFSIGTSIFKKNDNINQIIQKADKEMYNDKIEIKKRVTGIEI